MSLAVQARALYGFSRGNQALLSIAQPLVGALLATDHPAPGRLAAAVFATAAAFFAVFAANDLFDARLDRRSAAMAHTRAAPDIDSAGGGTRWRRAGCASRRGSCGCCCWAGSRWRWRSC